MRITSRLIAICCAVFMSTPVLADFVSKEQLSLKPLYSSALIESALNESDTAQRLIQVEQLVLEKGQWVGIADGEGELFPLHVTNYLLQRGYEDAAVRLLRSGAVEGWVSYPFQSGVVSDFYIALKFGATRYIEALVEYQASQINKPVRITLEGNETLPIAFLSTEEHVDKPYYESVLMTLLRGGADPMITMPNGVSPMLLANISNNTRFVQIVQSFRDKQFDSPEGFFKNSPLSPSQALEMQAVADLIIEESGRYKALPTSKLHDFWIKMILKGYNTPADLIYDILRRRDGFDINMANEEDITALMASSISSLYGGNVEYAALLIRRGADPKQLVTFVGESGQEVQLNLMQLSLQRDNYKMIALLIREGGDFVGIPGGEPEDFLLTQAIEQNALKSVMVLREALKRLMSKASE